jgi:PAS domain S-box-containing protein
MAANQELSTQAVDILVVDDTIASLRMLTEILTKAGYKARPVEDSQLALEAALAQPPSLILLEVKMPNISGFELCRRLKQDERTCDVPIIFVSALKELQDQTEGFKVGGVDFVSKPFQEAEVLARVKTHLQLRHTRLHLEALVAERTAELEKLLQERTEQLDLVEDQIRTLFEASTLGVAVTTFDGQFLTFNQALVNMLRTTEAELLQRNVSDVYADPVQRENLLNKLRESGNLRDFNLHLLRDDGTSFFARLNSVQLFLQGREVFMAMVDDVTEQMTAEHEAAVLEERARLARELHDAVTQTLFSASLLADTTPHLWDKDQVIARQNLNQLGRLLRGALAEMRTLLFELRPAAMKNQTLGQLLDPLIESARSRTRALVYLNVAGDRTLPENVTMAMLRIAQESLNNVAKHAEATEVNVDLACGPEGVVLRIRDDGRGFDPADIPPGHFGIGNMTDRARKIGATFKVESNPGGGTQVLVTWSEGGEENGNA